MIVTGKVDEVKVGSSSPWKILGDGVGYIRTMLRIGEGTSL